MTIVSIKEARANIGRIIDRAEQGEEIVVTRNGRKVAVIHGLPSLPRRLPGLEEFRKSINISGTPLSSTVLNNRSEERY